MKLRADHMLPLVLMLLLAAMTLWLRQLIETPQSREAAPPDHEPVAIVDRFTVTQLDPHGAPDYRLTARRMEHFADDNTTVLTAPQFTKREQDSTLTVMARRGTVEHDYRLARFYDDVRLSRTPVGEGAKSAEPLHAQTEYLEVIPDQDVAKTDQPVTITQGQSTLSGVGMEYNRRTGRLRLQSDVKGRYDARKK
jgi:lipopolysaccharide export system protein LptC